MVALTASDEAGALGLADLDEVLAGELDRGFVAFGAGGAEVGAAKAARLVADKAFGKFFGSVVGEQDCVDVCDVGELFSDCFIDPRMAMTQAGDRSAAGA